MWVFWMADRTESKPIKLRIIKTSDAIISVEKPNRGMSPCAMSSRTISKHFFKIRNQNLKTKKCQGLLGVEGCKPGREESA